MQECAAATWTGKVARYIDERLAVKTIPLTRGYEAIVDDEDFEELSKFKWHVLPSGKHQTFMYAARGETTTRKSIRMHRQIMGIAGFVDHANGNTLDNRRCNLRPATRAQNRANSMETRQGVSSRFRGVSARANGRWFAQCGHHRPGDKSYVGAFDTEIAAALAYDIAARKRFGQFAKLNFPFGIG